MPSNDAHCVDIAKTEFPFHGIIEIEGIGRFDNNVPNMTILEAAVAAFAARLGRELSVAEMASNIQLVEYNLDKPDYAKIAILNKITPAVRQSMLTKVISSKQVRVEINGMTTIIGQPITWADAVMSALGHVPGAPSPADDSIPIKH